jgi:hypothetical protein
MEFVIPTEFILKVSSGEYVRYGTIIKDSSGKIVGHLKEAGIESVLKDFKIPINPLSAGTEFIKATSGIAQNFQLREMHKLMESMQLVNNIGAVASVATLGVSVAGFAVVTQKLNQLEEKLDFTLEKVDRVLEIVENLNMKQEILEFAEIKTASEQLHNALFTEDIIRRKDLLTQANHIFHKYKNFYLKIAQDKSIWYDGQLPIEVANELYARYITCVMGQLYSEFLLGDLSCFRESWKVINKEVKTISDIDKIKILRNKSDIKASEIFGIDYDDLATKISNTQKILVETSNRVESMDYEAQYLLESNIEPFEYLKSLRNIETGLVLIKANKTD